MTNESILKRALRTAEKYGIEPKPENAYKIIALDNNIKLCTIGRLSRILRKHCGLEKADDNIKELRAKYSDDEWLLYCITHSVNS